MTSNEITNAGGNDGEGSEGNDRSKQLRILWRNLKQAVSEIDGEEAVSYCISFISILVFPLSAMGLAAPYYYLSVNIRPVSESILENLNCSELNIPEELLNQSVCSMGTFETQYSLFIRQANYFHFQPSFGVSFCEDDKFAYTWFESSESPFVIDEIPDDTSELIGGNNIGKCTQSKMFLTACLAAITMGFAWLGLLWLMVLSSNYSGSTRASYVHIFFCALTMTFSGLTIALYSITINPLRPGIEPNFCDVQTTFQDCVEGVGRGYYGQLSTAILSLLVFPLYVLKWKLKSSATSETTKTPVGHSRRFPFYRNPHWWIKLGRLFEFVLACVALMVNWTTLKLLLPDSDETPVEMSSYLWGDQFCAERSFAIDEFRLIEGNEELSDLKNFGDCKSIYKYKVVFTLLKIVASAGAALFLKRDAAKNPFIYLGGLVADIAAVVLVIMAIVVFMTQIYPGRPGIEPSFCDQYSSLRNMFLGDEEAPEDMDVCDISHGPGFKVLCLVLPLTVVNFFVEFLAGEIGSEYGAVNAFQTVLKRVKRKEYQDALFGPSSFYRNSESDAVKKSEVSEPIEEDANSIPINTEENAPNGDALS